MIAPMCDGLVAPKSDCVTRQSPKVGGGGFHGSLVLKTIVCKSTELVYNHASTNCSNVCAQLTRK